MSTKTFKSIGLWVGCALLAGCGDTFQPEPPTQPAAAEQLLREAGAADAAGRAPVLRWTSDGRVAAMFHRDRSPLFTFDGDEPRAGLIRWARSNARPLGLKELESQDTDARSGEPELELERRLEPVASLGQGRGLVVHRYHQRYRGHRVFGSGETLSVTSDGRGGVISVMGALIDNRRELAGLRDPIARDIAERTLLASLSEDARLEAIELVAVPERGTMAWLAKLHEATGPVQVLLSASTGEALDRRELSAHSPDDHSPVALVRGYTMTDNPATTSETNFPWLPGSTWDGSWNPIYGWMLRMGTDRMLVYDLEQANNAQPTVYLAMQYQPNTAAPGSYFVATAASDANKFSTQNGFHKVSAALQQLDARHSSFGWDHAPGSPFGVFTPGPLNLLTNIDTTPEAGEANLCNGALGKFNACTISGAAIQPAHPGIQTSCIYACVNRSGVLFHELGHYADHHATYGMMGTSVVSGTCIPDTTDEALPLRETLADMTTLYLTRKLYGALPYTFSTTTNPCSFASIGQGTSAIHDSACITSATQIGSFDEDRPGASNTQACGISAGYRMTSVNQAVWAYLNRRFCDTQSPFRCATVAGGNADEFMNGMIYAMSLSNAQSYETFFENIETWIWVALGDEEAQRFHGLMANYGILDP
jgi:hypothetical protein